jgi:hypothetical protein
MNPVQAIIQKDEVTLFGAEMPATKAFVPVLNDFIEVFYAQMVCTYK